MSIGTLVKRIQVRQSERQSCLDRQVSMCSGSLLAIGLKISAGHRWNEVDESNLLKFLSDQKCDLKVDIPNAVKSPETNNDINIFLVEYKCYSVDRCSAKKDQTFSDLILSQMYSVVETPYEFRSCCYNLSACTDKKSLAQRAMIETGV